MPKVGPVPLRRAAPDIQVQSANLNDSGDIEAVVPLGVPIIGHLSRGRSGEEKPDQNHGGHCRGQTESLYSDHGSDGSNRPLKPRPVLAMEKKNAGLTKLARARVALVEPLRSGRRERWAPKPEK